jgi:tRNA 2-thiocytidine biosynthesis protein TtcA
MGRRLLFFRGEDILFFMSTTLIAQPPWTKTGKRLESMCRKALFDFQLLEGVEKLGIALSGGKDSLSLLFLLKAILGRGFPAPPLYAFHVKGEFSCGDSLTPPFLKKICKELAVPLFELFSSQKEENLSCFSCSRERRRLIFHAAKKEGISAVAFGHHRDDNIQTLLLNLLHIGEFAGTLPKVPMQKYGVTIIRPLIYIAEKEIKAFVQSYGFARLTCQCPFGKTSKREAAKALMQRMEESFPHAHTNLSHAILKYGSKKALKP